ncbi:MAG TPA: SpoVA/SpoVAEb family sporulation membrane protein [Clostridia bacterium]|nr:SpoVA/SpoVAEb family sporulation membrane protein [Clostridia bacterium]HHY06077.1 SpoVA/SpoVAEb family sporulation membrane protein [Clostridia bacterium]
MELLKAFVLGGLLCALGQLLIDLTPFNITPGHILVGYVTSGVVLSFLGLYQPLVDWGGAGATVPLSGFGHSLAQGAIEGVKNRGLLGALGGGLEATSIGIATAIVLGLVVATFAQPKG